MSDVILYTSEDGNTKIDLQLKDGTAWLSQLQIAELFQTTKQNISKHIHAIYEDEELDEQSTVNQQLTVQKEGSREVERTLTFYNLDKVKKDYLDTLASLEKQAKKESRKKGGQV